MVNILVTGPPRSGKSTLISKIISNINSKVIGFITTEIRENYSRIGFEIETFSGHKKVLASKNNLSSRYRVGKYGIFLENLNFIIDRLQEQILNEECDLIIIDEIGKMELFSQSFRNFVLKALDENKVLGTIMLKDNDFTYRIKTREDTTIFMLSEQNRKKMISKIEELVS
ncbi:MAG: AAA family ATPase [Candidatus Heimdallarchaeota archaeon]|nr:AAA family ATPase [Candidatus Heimdallarchaeota archaeon]